MMEKPAQAYPPSPCGRLEGEVRAGDLDLGGRMGAIAALRWFQDAVWLHAEDLGVGQETFHARHLAWVIVRQEVLFAPVMPSWRAPLTLCTWPRTPDRLYYYRDYLLRSGDQTVARCATAWIVMDLANSCPVHPEDCEGVHTHPLPPVTGKVPPRIRFRPEDGDERGSRRVCFGDLDPSGHLNHTRAAEWMLDLLPPDALHHLRLKRWSLNYLREARPGTVLETRHRWVDEGLWEAGLLLDTDQPSALCQAEWVEAKA